MSSRIILTLVLIFSIVLFAACGDSEQPNKNTKPSANTPVNKPANEGSLTTVAKTPEPETNAAATLGPVFKAYCDAIAKKDDAAVRKFYSAAALKELDSDMKDEKTTSIVAYLATDQISECQVANEKIDGDSGSAVIKTKGAPNGARVKFIKENGEWKLTGETVDVQSVRQAAGNSNSTK